MRYFFGLFPIEYLHHDRTNPRTIGGSSKGLLEEFHAGRPQLHVSLAWWPAVNDGSGPLKVFDGQHKAAAQILLGAKNLPVKVFVDPDLKVLLQAETNASNKLKQVAFDMAAKRHLGSTPLHNSITSDPENRLMEFVEMAGKAAERPVSYSAVEKRIGFEPENLNRRRTTTPGKRIDARPIAEPAATARDDPAFA
jgi:hypothetical protein